MHVQPLDVLLMSPPRPDWQIRGSANVFSQQAGAGARPIERGAALAEWLSLADAIQSAPAEVVVLPFTDDNALTGMPYTAEGGFLGRLPGSSERVFLLPNVKPEHRRKEAVLIDALMTSWGIATRTLPVLWEGQGDVLDAGTDVALGPAGGRRFVCTSGEGPHARTSPAAYQHVAPFLPGRSVHVRFRADPWFHGNTFLGFFFGSPAGAPPNVKTVAVVCEEALLPGEAARLRAFLPDVRFVVITAAESLRYGTNALQVKDRVLAPRGVPDVIRRAWDELGLTVVELDLPLLFGRGGGAAVCMTNRLDLHVDDVPRASRYENVRASLRAVWETA